MLAVYPAMEEPRGDAKEKMEALCIRDRKYPQIKVLFIVSVQRSMRPSAQS